MKKFLFAIALFGAAVSLYSQNVTKGSFSALLGESIVNLKMDYSEAQINKVPFSIFLETEENWDEGYKEIQTKLVKEFNKQSVGIKCSLKTTANYQLVFKAVTVDRDGETIGYLELRNKDGNVLGVAENFDAEGGTFGSQLNLMGDAAKELGEILAKFLVKALKENSAKDHILKIIQDSGEGGITSSLIQKTVFKGVMPDVAKRKMNTSLKELEQEQKIKKVKDRWYAN